MRRIFKRRLWIRVLAVTLALALNLGALDGIINGILHGAFNLGVTDSLVRVNNVPPAYADPGDGSFQPSVFDPNHDETSTLTFRFDYNHHVRIDLLLDGEVIETLDEDAFYRGDYIDREDRKTREEPRNIINHYTWDGKDDNGEPMDDGNYSIKMTPLDEWSDYPLIADVRIKNYPHIPTHDVYINYLTGLITVKGNSDKNNKIILYVNGVERVTITDDGSGRWQWSSYFNEGIIYSVTAEAENKWGTRSKGRSVASIFEIYQVRKSDVLADIADFYYFWNDKTTAQRKLDITNATGLPPEDYLQTDWYLLIKNPTVEAIYSDYLDASSLPDKTDETYGNWPNCENQGEPVNPITGNYFSEKTDLAINGRGLPLEFTRTYNNKREYKGPLGWGWDFTYNQKLDFFKDGQIGHHRGDGGVNYFAPDGQGGYIPPVGNYDTLVKNPDRSFTLTKRDKTTYHFDLSGRLRTISDRNGNQIKLNYDEHDLIVSAQESGGYRITFTYDTKRRVKKVSDQLGREVIYEYNQAGDLTSVKDVRGGITKYEYNDKHWLMKSFDPKDYLIIENTYDDQGRVINQKDAGDNIFYFDYDPANKRTTCTNNRGIETVFEYDEHYRQTRKVTSAQTRLITVYDTQGNLKEVLDPKGNGSLFEYDDRGNLISAADKAGKWTIFKYDDNDNLLEITDPMQNKTVFEYDPKGNITKIIDAAGKETAFTYNTHGQPETITDPRGYTSRLEYNGAGNLTKATNGREYSYSYGYDAVGRRISVTDPKDKTTQIKYDAYGQVTKLTSPLNQEIKYEYDLNGNLTVFTDAKETKTYYEYDKRDNLVKVTDAVGNTTRMEYDPNSNLTKVVNAREKATQYKYDEFDRLTEVTDTLGSTRKMSYDENNNITLVTDARGNMTGYAYDKLSRLISVTNALNQSTGFEYDDISNLLKITDPAGAVTRYEYDKLSRVTKIIDALGQETVITYDANGNRTMALDPKKRAYYYGYDQANNLTETTDPTQAKTIFEYDENNNLTSVTDALNKITRLHYDAVNQPVEVINPLGSVTKVEYDKNGNRIKVTDAEDHTTQYRYDPLNRLSKVIDALNNTTEYKYDELGNLRQVSDANRNSTVYEYTYRSQLAGVLDAIGNEKAFCYDGNGNLTEKMDGNGDPISYVYDKLNRLISVQYPDLNSVNYQYDRQGNRSSMEDPNGTTSYEYDLLGQLLAVTTPDSKRLEYAYDSTGRRTQLKYPDGREVKYQYDQMDRLTEVTDWSNGSTKYTYDAIGRRTGTVLPNGVTTNYQYDEANRLLSLANVNGAGKLLSKFEYAYDKTGSRTGLTETTGDETRTTQYQYDPLYQLNKVLRSDGTETGYTYDPAGNRLEKVDKAGETTARTKYSYNQANEMLSLTKDGDEGPTTFDYDANGSLLMETRPESRTTSYSYDFANRLVRVDLPQDKFVEYGYDGDDNRIVKMAAKSPSAAKPDKGKGPDDKVNHGNGPENKQARKQNTSGQATIMAKGGGGKGGGNGGGNGGGGGGNGGSGGSGNGNNNNGGGNGSEKDNNGKGSGVENDNKEKWAEKEKSLNGKGYKGKGKYENKGKHLGWYKNGKYGEMPENPELIETTYYLNDIADPLTQVLMTYDEKDNYKAAYAYGLERFEVQALDSTRPESQDPLYYLYDGLGSVTQLTRPNGEVRDHYGYDEYGVPAPGAKLSEDGRNVNHNAFGYTGELWDEEDELLYLRSRFYLPEIGRFLGSDIYPGLKNNPLSLNKYAYVENNPINFIDPLGFSKKDNNIFSSEMNSGIIRTASNSGIVTTASLGKLNRGNDSSISQEDIKWLLKNFDSEWLEYDWAGATILWWYLFGEGKERNIQDNSLWTYYMKSNKTLKSNVKNLLMNQVTGMKKNSTIGIDIETSMEIENGESIIGYQYLHGTNADVGGFQISGTAKKDEKDNITFDIHIQWNDIIDPNFQYSTDQRKARLAQEISGGKAAPYTIRIGWDIESVYVAEKKSWWEVWKPSPTWPFN